MVRECREVFEVLAGQRGLLCKLYSCMSIYPGILFWTLPPMRKMYCSRLPITVFYSQETTVRLLWRGHHEKQKLDRAMLGIPLTKDDLVFSTLEGKPLRPNTVIRAWEMVAFCGDDTTSLFPVATLCIQGFVPPGGNISRNCPTGNYRVLGAFVLRL